MKIKTELLVLFSAAAICAQPVSIHKLESETHKRPAINSSAVLGAVNKTSGLNSTPTLNRAVFGFLPYWEYLNGDFNSVKYNLLTHIAVFSFEADSTGALTDPPGWPWIDFINLARNNNVRIIMTITCFDPNSIHKLLNDFTIRRQLFTNLLKKILTQSLDGVNIDFENLIDTDKLYGVRNFFDDFKTFFSGFNLEVSFSSPAAGFGQWDFDSIAANCDYFFVMCYDFYGSWSSTTGPSSPLTGPTGNSAYNVFNTFSSDYASIVHSTPGKLILGVPYYGNYWITSSRDAYAPVTPLDTLKKKNNWQNVMAYKDIAPISSKYGALWDNGSQTPWVRWQDTVWNQIWFDNDSSLALKFDLAIMNNLKGVGIWALGYDNGRNELWNLIDRKFNRPVGVQGQNSSIPTAYRLEQNYPNPFNPSTTIKYSIPAVEIPSSLRSSGQADPLITLKVYDLLGREVAILVNEEKAPGNYTVKFDGSGLSSGLYFYTLRAGDFFQSRKMIFLK